MSEQLSLFHQPKHQATTPSWWTPPPWWTEESRGPYTDTRHPAAHPCPTCNAPPGYSCSGDGYPMTQDWHHATRWALTGRDQPKKERAATQRSLRRHNRSQP